MPPKRLYYDGDSLVNRYVLSTIAEDMRLGILPNGGLLGVLDAVTQHFQVLRPHGGAYFFFDAGIPKYRTELVPEYKAHRAGKRAQSYTPEHLDAARAQKATIRDLLRALGFGVGAAPGWEADDCLAWATTLSPAPLLVSGDKDVFQAVALGCSVFDLNSRTLLAPDNFLSVTGVSPGHYLLYKLLVGDPSDGLSGAKGCGKARACSVVKDLSEGLSAAAQLTRLCGALRKGPRKGWQDSIYFGAADLFKQLAAISFPQAAKHFSAAQAYKAFSPGTGVLDTPRVVAILRQHGLSRRLADVSRYERLFRHSPFSPQDSTPCALS